MSEPVLTAAQVTAAECTIATATYADPNAVGGTRWESFLVPGTRGRDVLLAKARRYATGRWGAPVRLELAVPGSYRRAGERLLAEGRVAR